MDDQQKIIEGHILFHLLSQTCLCLVKQLSFVMSFNLPFKLK